MWLGTWANRLELTISSAVVDATLTDFPVMVKLSAASGIGDVDASPVFDELTSDANRKKIAVTSSDGTTQLYCEIEKWDDANELAWLHIKVPSISSSVDTIIYLYYDSAQADNTTYIGDTTDAVTHNVWDANFKAVYHMAQDPNGDTADAIKDSTVNANEGTPSGTMLTADLVTGQVGKAIELDGGDDYINFGPIADFTGDMTISLIAKKDGTDFYTIVAKRGSTPQFQFYGVSDGDTGVLAFWNGVAGINNGATISNNVWHHLAVVRSGTDITFYVDGATSGSTQTLATPGTSGEDVLLGYDSVSSWANGTRDEFQISSIARSAAWIKATYNSLWDSLITFNLPFTPDNSDHLQVVDNVDLTQKHEIVVQSATHLQTVEGPRLIFQWTQATFQLTSNGDDGYYRLGDDRNSTNTALFIGPDYALSVQFPNISIPPNARIKVAFVTFECSSTQSRVGVVNCSFVDNPEFTDFPVKASDFYALTLTDTIDYRPNEWTSGQTYNSPDLSSLIQGIVDQSTWESGNSLAFVIENDGLNGLQSCHAYDTSIGDPMTLHIVWDAVESRTHLQTVENVSVNLHLDPVDANHLQTVENVLVNRQLIPTKAAQLQICTNVILTQKHLLEVSEELYQSQSVESTTLTQKHILSLQDSFYIQSVSNLGSFIVLELSSPYQTLTSDVPIINFSILINGAYHLNVSAAPSLTQKHTLVSSGAYHLQSSENPIITSPSWIAANEHKTAHAYMFVLTGHLDGLPDIQIPMSSFQARRPYLANTYLSVQLPGVDYATEIAARPNGYMQVYAFFYLDGISYFPVQLANVYLEDIVINEGVGSSTISLVGHRQKTFAAGAVTLENIVSYQVRQGKYQYRCSAPDLYLNPGDTVTADGNVFIADEIQYLVSPQSQIMQVKGT